MNSLRCTLSDRRGCEEAKGKSCLCVGGCGRSICPSIHPASQSISLPRQRECIRHRDLGPHTFRDSLIQDSSDWTHFCPLIMTAKTENKTIQSDKRLPDCKTCSRSSSTPLSQSIAWSTRGTDGDRNCELMHNLSLPIHYSDSLIWSLEFFRLFDLAESCVRQSCFQSRADS